MRAAGARRRPVPALLVAAALGVGAPAAAQPHLNVRYTEINPELDGLTRGDYSKAAQTIYLSWYAGVRGGYTGSNADGTLKYGRWYQAHVARVAFYAFANGLILDPPEKYAPLDFHIFHADCCVNSTLGLCGNVNALKVMTQVLLGDGDRPPVVGLIGGEYETGVVGQLSSSQRVPDVGFYAGASSLADKAIYPFFLRTNADDSDIWVAAITLVRSLKFTKFLIWHNSVADSMDAKAQLKALAAQYNMVAASVQVPLGTPTALPPAKGSAEEETWLAMVNVAAAINAHCHLMAVTPNSPTYDILGWLWTHSLIGAGHFWLGFDPYISLYQTIYIPVIQHIFPTILHLDSPFGRAVPFEGYVSVMASYEGPKFEQSFKPFWKSLQDETLRNQVFEPLMRIYTDSDMFTAAGLPYLVQPFSNNIFDAVWAMMLASNKLALQYGKAFTSEQLWAEVLKSDFEGLSGQVRFAPNGNRVLPFVFRNYNRCAARGKKVPHVRHLGAKSSGQAPLAAMVSAKDLHQRLLKACVQEHGCVARLLQGLSPGTDANSTNASGGLPSPAPGPTETVWPCYPGFPEPGEDVDVAKFEDGVLSFFLPLIFYGCNMQPPPDQDLACKPGSVYDRGDGVCVDCPAGKAATSGQICSPCAPGSFARDAGSSVCAACELGKYAAAEMSTMCKNCPAGWYQGEVQSSGCRQCPKGKFAEGEKQPACTDCPVGTYAPSLNSTSCRACRDGTSTMFPGQIAAGDCRCKSGSYSETEDGDCLPCKEGMSCPFGANVENWMARSARSEPRRLSADAAASGAASDVYPTLMPKYWADSDNPLEVWECKSVERCPGGDPGTCGDRLSDKSCAHCSPGYQWDGGSCVPCTVAGRTRWIFPTIPLLLIPIVLLYLYQGAAGGVNTWNSWTNHCACLIFVLLSHYQVLNLLGTANVTIPKALSVTIQIWDTTNDASTPFKIPCQGFQGFAPVMIIRVLLPLVLAAWCFVLYAISAILGVVMRKERMRLDGDRLFNVYMSIIYTFFNAIASLALALFKCKGNPNGRSTLVADLSVVCFEDGTWMDLLAVSICAVLVYCLGCGILFVYIIIRALNKFADPHFRIRWKFLFIKYRPDVWWFSLTFLGKNFLFNFVFVLFTDGASQLYLMMLVLTIYTGLVVEFRPYRAPLASTLEIAVGIVLIFISSVMTNFAQIKDKESSFSTPTAVLSWVPIAGGLGLVVWIGYTTWAQKVAGWKRTREHSETIKLVTRIREAAFILVRLKDEQFMRFFFEQIGEVDRHGLNRLAILMEAEVKGLKHPRLVADSSSSSADLVPRVDASGAPGHLLQPADAGLWRGDLLPGPRVSRPGQPWARGRMAPLARRARGGLRGQRRRQGALAEPCRADQRLHPVRRLRLLGCPCDEHRDRAAGLAHLRPRLHDPHRDSLAHGIPMRGLQVGRAELRYEHSAAEPSRSTTSAPNAASA